jgi:hypothetical protein
MRSPSCGTPSRRPRRINEDNKGQPYDLSPRPQFFNPGTYAPKTSITQDIPWTAFPRRASERRPPPNEPTAGVGGQHPSPPPTRPAWRALGRLRHHPCACVLVFTDTRARPRSHRPIQAGERGDPYRQQALARGRRLARQAGAPGRWPAGRAGARAACGAARRARVARMRAPKAVARRQGPLCPSPRPRPSPPFARPNYFARPDGPTPARPRTSTASGP